MQAVIDYFDKPLLKVSMVFGVITGLLAFIFFLALYLLRLEPLSNIRVLDMGIFIILISGACWYYRKNVGKGLLHLWEALTIGYVVLCVAAIINGWLIYLFVSYVDSSVFTDYISAGLHLLDQDRKTQLSYLTEPEFIKMYKEVQDNKPSIIIKNEIVQKFILGIIPILVISLIFRRQDYGLYSNK